MELVYLWVEDYKNIKKQGFNFSPRFRCDYDENKNRLEIIDKEEIGEPYLKNFFGENINITAIVGENGSGKSSIIENIFEFLESELLEKRTLIIYYEDNQYTCITDIVDINTSSIKNITTVQNNQHIISKKLFVYNHRYEHRYRVFRSYRTMEVDKLGLINLLVFNYDQSIDFHLTNFMYQPTKINIKYKDKESIISLIESMSSSTEELVKLYKEERDPFMKFLITLCARDGIDKLEFYKNEKKMIARLNLSREELSSLHIDFIKMNKNFPFTLENKEEIKKYIGREYFNLFEFDLFDEKGRNYNSLSHGEQILFGLLLNISFYSRNESSIFLLDEPELSLHPQWQKVLLTEIITLLKKFTGNKYQLIMTSHSPFILSDLPKENIIFLEKDKKTGDCINASDKVEINPFGANIHTLLSHGFFMKDGLMGEFAKDKIQSIIKYHEEILKCELTKKDNKTQRDAEKERYEKEHKTIFWEIQSIIGDDYLKQVVKNHLIEIEKIVLGNDEANKEEVKRLKAQIELLENKMLKIEYNNTDLDKYYEIISNRKMQKFENRTFESYYNSCIKNKLGNYSLRDILCGDFNKLLEVKSELGKKYSNQTNIMKQFFNYDKRSKKANLKVSSFQPKISKFFEENIEVHTCYYCNIDFINTFKKGKETKNAFTLDHVLEKADYPFLALSLYNLVPSCYVCNSKVKDSKIAFDLFSPTNKDFDFDEKVKFKSFITNENLQIEKEQDFYIKLIENYSNKYDKYIESLNLDSRYDYHKYKVLEMIQKRREYPDSRIKELSDLTKKTQEEIKQDLFGIYTNEDLHKRPLSKLIKDISEELDLI